MEFYNGTLCIPANEYYHQYDGKKPGKGKVVKENYVPYGTYLRQSQAKLRIVRKGGGKANPALIDFESIPMETRMKVRKDNPKAEKEASEKPLYTLVKKDYKAVQFYIDFRFPDGSEISTERKDNILLWSNNAAIMNALVDMYRDHVKARAKLGKGPLKKDFFTNAASALYSEKLNEEFPNNLPRNQVRLQQKFELYKDIQYMAFVKNNESKNNAIKINAKIFNLLQILSTLPTRPYNTTVNEMYIKFMQGRLEVVNAKTGEQYLPQDYLNEKGDIVTFTDQAINQRLNKPGTQVIIDKKRMGAKDFNDLHRPHHHRHSPELSFSKISLDDRDLVWKDSDSEKRVKAYYAYDVASGCRVGSSYSMTKDETLFLDCLRDMFVFIDRHSFGIPLEVEVEHHLVNKFFDDLAIMFPYLTICAAGNSQQKRAEHFNRAVKYQVEKNNHPGIGRWWLKSKYNRVSLERVGDDFKMQMKPVDRLIADDILDTIEYNYSLHKNQKKYPGMTRMDVLLENLNPALPKFNKQYIYRYIGFKQVTTITRSQYIQVQYAKYGLPSPAVLDKLASNNREVEAYYMPDEEGSIPEVYLYQNDKFICTCARIETYNEAKAEFTELDEKAMVEQAKYIAKFDKFVKDGVAELPQVEVMKPNKNFDQVPAAEVMTEARREVKVKPASTDYSQKAIDDYFN